MSQGDFGYGSGVRPYRDDPDHEASRVSSFPSGHMPGGYQGSGNYCYLYTTAAFIHRKVQIVISEMENLFILK